MVSNWQEDTFERLFESAPDAAIVVDADGRIVHANAHVEELFGYSRDELRGLRRRESMEKSES